MAYDSVVFGNTGPQGAGQALWAPNGNAPAPSRSALSWMPSANRDACSASGAWRHRRNTARRSQMQTSRCAIVRPRARSPAVANASPNWLSFGRAANLDRGSTIIATSCARRVPSPPKVAPELPLRTPKLGQSSRDAEEGVVPYHIAIASSVGQLLPAHARQTLRLGFANTNPTCITCAHTAHVTRTWPWKASIPRWRPPSLAPRQLDGSVGASRVVNVLAA